MTRSTEKGGRLPVLCGADVELANFIVSSTQIGNSSRRASRLLLAAMPGIAAKPVQGSAGAWNGHQGTNTENPQDQGRKFLAENGACTYIDLDHLEVAQPECLSAYDHVATWHAMLRLVQGAIGRVNEQLPGDERVCVLANNSDGLGHSYGSHLNFLVTRRTFHDIFFRRIQPMLVLAAFQASSIVFAGAGKAGCEVAGPRVDYQISQRADFIETVFGVQTTYLRPLVNGRDEPLCGRATGRSEDPVRRFDLARLHVISYDSTLCQVASLLKVGVYQLILAQIEAGVLGIDCALEDPVLAMRSWSRDPQLRATARMARGSKLTAVQLQFRFLEQSRRFLDQGGFDGRVPHAADILALWEDTLLKLECRAFDELAPRLDWVLKMQILERAMDMRSNLDWSSAEVKQLDHMYSNIDPSQGLYWKYAGSGAVEVVVPETHIDTFTREAPPDTRAWTRAALLRLATQMDVEVVEAGWDHVRLRPSDGRWPYEDTVDLADPLGFTVGQVGPIIDRAVCFRDVLEGLATLNPEKRRRGSGPTGPERVIGTSREVN